MSEIEYQRVPTTEAGQLRDELSAVYRAVFSQPPYEHGEDFVQLFAERFAVQHQWDGATLITAREPAGALVGFSFGFAMPNPAGWWTDLVTDIDPEIAAEYPGRTFAMIELLVLEAWQGRGIASQLHDMLLEDRPEQRATLTVRPDASEAQPFYAHRGWRKAGQKRNPLPGRPIYDILLKDLP